MIRTTTILILFTIIAQFSLISQFSTGVVHQRSFSITNSRFKGYNFDRKANLNSNTEYSYATKLKLSWAWNQRNSLTASIRSGLMLGSASATYNEYINVDGDLYFGESEFITEFELRNVAFELCHRFQLIDLLYLSGGLTVLNPFEADYRQEERINYPADRGVYLETGRRSKNEIQSELDELNSIVLSGSLNATYSFPLSQKNDLFLNFSFGYEHQFSSILKEKELKIHQFGVGVGMEYYLSGNQERLAYESSTKEESLFYPRISISAFDENNKPLKNLRLTSDGKIKPKTVLFRTAVSTDVAISEWRLVLLHNDKTIQSLSGESMPPAIVSLDISPESASILVQLIEQELSNKLSYNLYLIDKSGRTATGSEGSINLIVE